MRKFFFLALMLTVTTISRATAFLIERIDNGPYIIADGIKKMRGDTINGDAHITWLSYHQSIEVRTLGPKCKAKTVCKKLMEEKHATTLNEINMAGKDIADDVDYCVLYNDGKIDTLVYNADSNYTYNLLFQGSSYNLPVKNSIVSLSLDILGNTKDNECLSDDAWLYATDTRNKNTIQPRKIRIYIIKGCE